MTLGEMRVGTRNSVVWKFSREEIQEFFDISSTISEILILIGLTNRGSNFKTLKCRTVEDNIDLTLFKINKSKNRKPRRYKNFNLDDVLIEKSTYSRHSLKRRLLELGKLINKCVECGIGPIYNNRPLSLQLDHINGICDDNRLSNLRILCPNCHSQTESFAGKNIKKPMRVKILKGRNGPRYGARKVARPSREVLNKLLWEKPTIEIAKEFNVSDSAVGKWAKTYGIQKPPRGYWTMRNKIESLE